MLYPGLSPGLLVVLAAYKAGNWKSEQGRCNPRDFCMVEWCRQDELLNALADHLRILDESLYGHITQYAD